MQRPASSEYPAYYEQYISLIQTDNILDHLAAQRKKFLDIIHSIPEQKGNYAYAEGKWTIKELLGHINDGERIMGYRAMRIARNDQTPLPGFEQNDYVQSFDASKRSLKNFAEEFGHLRDANLVLFSTFGEEESTRVGTANGKPVSVRGLAYIIAGHTEHHLQILLSRYL